MLLHIRTDESAAHRKHVVDAVVRSRHGEYRHVLVFGQRHRPRTFGNIERNHIHVREVVRQVALVALMAVRADMRDRRILEERFAVSAPAPLSVEAFPKRHIDGLLGVAHLEEGLALLVRSGHQHVELPVTAFGQFDLLTAARHGVLDVLLAHHEPYAVAGQFGGNQFGGEAAPIRLLNPIASQLSVMRTQLIGGLVDILRYNLNRKEDRVRVFELGRVFFQDPTIEPSDTSVKGVRQPEHLAGLAYGTADAPQWGIKSRRVDFFDVKGDLERLAFPLTLDFVPEVFPSLHPGRSAGVYLDGKRIGLIGELHPRLQQAYDLPLCPVVFEIDVEPLLSVPVPEHKPVSKFQKSLRDISLAVPASVTSKQIFDAVRAARRTDVRLACLTDFRLFDVYHPENQPSADKSMAFRLVLESFGEEAVTEAQIEGATEAVIAGLEPLGIKLRAELGNL